MKTALGKNMRLVHLLIACSVPCSIVLPTQRPGRSADFLPAACLPCLCDTVPLNLGATARVSDVGGCSHSQLRAEPPAHHPGQHQGRCGQLRSRAGEHQWQAQVRQGARTRARGSLRECGRCGRGVGGLRGSAISGHRRRRERRRLVQLQGHGGTRAAKHVDTDVSSWSISAHVAC